MVHPVNHSAKTWVNLSPPYLDDTNIQYMDSNLEAISAIVDTIISSAWDESTTWLDQDVSIDGTPTFASLTLSGLTTGNILFAGANGLITGDSNLVFDSANGRLGIGTDTPTDKLHVTGGLRIDGSTTSHLFFV
ncbi:MAG: hypothetical protein PHZ19_11950, partial [Candidatus Thermoplasmatota archaeon]|nr:hypothetical protein [Candidatus Thermoplasmatota archaeon]